MYRYFKENCMVIRKEMFGEDKDGNTVYKYTVEGENISASFCETGAAIMSIIIKDADGKDRDVVLGFDDYRGYSKNWMAFGAVIGRCANRINGAKFILNDKKYKLEKNIPGGCLHSGYSYQYRSFESESFEDEAGAHIIFKLFSEDGDQGFSGNLDVKIEYLVAEDSSLTIKYYAKSDADTVVNMTNHVYINLNGHNSGTAISHKLKIMSDRVTQFDKKLMPTGEIMNIKGSAYDFTELTTIEDNMKKDFKPFSKDKEYDMNYVLSDRDGEYKQAVYLVGDKSGISMKVYTDMPGMQFYTGNAVNGCRGKSGHVYEKYPGLCFETQYFPDAINQPSFVSPVLKAGEDYCRTTRFEFGCGGDR